jgi:hypothetical protein
MEHIRAFWWGRRKKRTGRGLNYNLKIALKVNIERQFLKVKRAYKIKTQGLREDMI